MKTHAISKKNISQKIYHGTYLGTSPTTAVQNRHTPKGSDVQ